MKRTKSNTFCCGERRAGRKERIEGRRGVGWGGGHGQSNEGGGALGGRVAWLGLAATVEKGTSLSFLSCMLVRSMWHGMTERR